MDDLLREFLSETGEHVDAAGAHLVRLERDPTDTAMIAAVFRLLHTIKGTCGFLGLGRLGRLAHAAETLLERLRQGAPATPQTVALIMAAVDRIRFILSEIETRETEPEGGDDDLVEALASETALAPAGSRPSDGASAKSPDSPTEGGRGERAPERDRAASVRVAVETLELIMTLVSELVLARNQLAVIARRSGQHEVESGLQRLSSIVTDLQDSVMRARMQPLERLFGTLPRLVRALSRDLGKSVDLTIEGARTELDRQLVELVRDPLTHLVRNCVDHGIETAQERLAFGKPATGHLRIVASQAAGQVLIEISDDGRGLSSERIAQRALALGLTTEDELANADRDEIVRHIFASGFSTAAQVTSVSGRGVGLDIVRANIEAIGGSVGVESTEGSGTRFTLRIPLTLAIAPALIVTAAGERFAIAQSDVVEIVEIGADTDHTIETVHGCDVLHLRGAILPVADLRDLLRLPERTGGAERLIVVLRTGAVAFGIVLDGVEDVQEIVVKPVGATLANLQAYAGHTILGDGSVVLLLDVRNLARTLGVDGAVAHREATPVDRSERPTTPLLLVRAGSPTVHAIPLSLLSRIEMVPVSEIEAVAGHLLWRREGRLVALVPLIEAADPKQLLEGSTDRPVLMVERDGRLLGLIVDEIVDVVDGAGTPEIVGRTPGVSGAATVGPHVAAYIDAASVADRVSRSAGMSTGCHVLLLGAEPLLPDTLAPVLAAAGCRMSVASTWEQAQTLLDGTGFDIAIVDGAVAGRPPLIAQVRDAAPAAPLIAAVADANGMSDEAAAPFAQVCSVTDRRAILVALERVLRTHPGARRKAAR